MSLRGPAIDLAIVERRPQLGRRRIGSERGRRRGPGDALAKRRRGLGAQIVVRGAVTEFEEQASGGGAGIRFGGFGAEGSVRNAHVALDIRLIDTSTGQVIASHNAAKSAPAVC